MQIGKSYTCFSLEKMPRSARAKQYRKAGRRKKQFAKQTSNARAAFELRDVQNELLLERNGEAADKPSKKRNVTTFNLKGNRIVNISHLGKSLQSVIGHGSVCPCDGKPRMEQEIERKGLGCVIQFRCDGSNMTLAVETQPKSKGPGGQLRHSINIAAVWGFMAMGGGHSNIKEILSVLNIPSPDKNTFKKIEEQIGSVWKEAITADMLEAGQEERRLAVAAGEIDQGVPAINVIVDGGWSMRSNQHRYSAKSGVAVIIGERTKKLLYLGVRNKFCSICPVAANKKILPQSHNCYKNWDESSSAMEKDIITEGFSERKTCKENRVRKSCC